MEFNCPLSYIELLLPILSELELVSWSYNDLIVILRENKIFKKYSDDDLKCEVDLTLKYLIQVGYVEVVDGEYSVTSMAIDLLNKVNDEKDKILESSMSDSEKLKKLQDIYVENTKNINFKIKKAYNIPSQSQLCEDLSKYLEHNSISSKSRSQIINDFIKHVYNFTDEQMSVLVGIVGRKKEAAIISRAYSAFYKLRKEKKEEVINKKNSIRVKKLDKQDKTLKVKPNLHESCENDKVTETTNDNAESCEDITSIATFNVYSDMILRILSSSYTSDIQMITKYIINIIMPKNNDENIFELFKTQINKILTQMIQKQLIIKTDEGYEIIQKGFNQINKAQQPPGTRESENLLKQFNQTYHEINQTLHTKLLRKIKTCNPYFFEKISLDLLKQMQYFNVKAFKGELSAKSNDGGVDGVLYYDRLSIKPVYFQSKRWKNNITRPEMQKFVGALHDKGATDGIFITTSNFTKGALETAKSSNVRPINGEMLVNLMIEYKVGVKTQNYELDTIDEQYFQNQEEKI